MEPQVREPVRRWHCRLKGESWGDNHRIPTLENSRERGTLPRIYTITPQGTDSTLSMRVRETHFKGEWLTHFVSFILLPSQLNSGGIRNWSRVGKLEEAGIVVKRSTFSFVLNRFFTISRPELVEKRSFNFKLFQRTGHLNYLF